MSHNPSLGSVLDIVQITGNTGYVLQEDTTLRQGVKFAAITAASLPSAIDAAKIADGSVSNIEFQYVNGVTSAIQTQLDSKGSPYHAHVTSIGGTGDAITGTISPARTLVAGDRITFKATAANTGATTIALTGATPATAVAIQKGPGTALAANDIDNGGMYTAVYDGSVWLCPNYGFA